MPRFLLPPPRLLARVRWLFLLLALFNAAVMLVMLLLVSSTDRVVQVAALVGLVWLCWRGLRGYQLMHFSLGPVLFEGLALLLVGLAVSPMRALGLFYISLFFRALYGSVHRVATITVVYLGVYIGANIIAAHYGGAALSLVVINQALGFLVLAGMIHVLGRTLQRHEAAVTQERLLREAGAALVVAPDLGRVCVAVRDSAHALLSGGGQIHVWILVGAPDALIIAATSDQAIRDATAVPLDLATFPRSVQAPLLAHQCVEVPVSATSGMPDALGIPSGMSWCTAVPLTVHGGLRGITGVSSESPIGREQREALITLGSMAALAIDSTILAENLHQRRSDEHFRALVQNGSDIIAIIDAGGILRYTSPSLVRILGFQPEQWVGWNVFGSIHWDDLPRARQEWALLLADAGSTRTIVFRMRHAGGTWRYLEANAANLLHDPITEGVVMNIRDITEHKLLEDQLAHQAFYDSLTGLPNRALLMDRLNRALARGSRSPAYVAVLFLDLDHFQVINDSLGHAAGDRLLMAVAEQIEGCAQPEDTVARLGGDEFAILIEETNDVIDAVHLAERIAECLRAPVVIDGREIVVTTSIGVTLSARGGSGADALVRDADVALYAAKAKGRARCEVFDPSMGARAFERLELEEDLRHAIPDGALRVVYQPIVNLATGQMLGMEALARWQHPRRGLLPPSEFIPMAEQSGLILAIDGWVIEEACRQLQEWRLPRPAEPCLVMSVNLSARQFDQPDLVEMIARALHASGLPPHALKLEITESIAMGDADSAVATLNALKALGVQIAIDDFGTGYSSLSYLKRFPVDTLKIDRSFVVGLGHDAENTAIVRAVIALAKSLGLSVTGEGIETAEQLHELQSLGCDQGQGYYFARPLTANAFGARLNDEITRRPRPITSVRGPRPNRGIA